MGNRRKNITINSAYLKSLETINKFNLLPSKALKPELELRRIASQKTIISYNSQEQMNAYVNHNVKSKQEKNKKKSEINIKKSTRSRKNNDYKNQDINIEIPKKKTGVKNVSQKTKCKSRKEKKHAHQDLTFLQWLKQFEDPEEKEARNSMKKKKEKKAKRKKNKLKKRVEASIKTKNKIVSVSLAELLESQGHKKKATKMYQQLSLLFPEKSSFFATKIDKLKKS